MRIRTGQNSGDISVSSGNANAIIKAIFDPRSLPLGHKRSLRKKLVSKEIDRESTPCQFWVKRIRLPKFRQSGFGGSMVFLGIFAKSTVSSTGMGSHLWRKSDLHKTRFGGANQPARQDAIQMTRCLTPSPTVVRPPCLPSQPAT
jgi:hypothetical protein